MGKTSEFNDEELRRWVEEEKKTQAEIAEMVGRDQSRVSRRCSALGIVSGDPRGGDRRSFDAGASNPDELEVVDAEYVDAEVVEDAPRRTSPRPRPRRRQEAAGRIP